MRKILIQFPSYAYFSVDPEVLPKLLSGDCYKYDWDLKKFFLESSDFPEVRIVDPSNVIEMSKEKHDEMVSNLPKEAL
jgi:hypothetical protein